MDNQPSRRDFGGQVRDLARVLREQWWIILLCLFLTTFAAAAYTSTLKKEYETSAKLLLQSDNLSSTIAGTTIGGVDPTRQSATDAQLAGSPAVAARVRKVVRGGLGDASVSASASADSNILTITVRDTDPARAPRIANAFARQFIIFRRDTTRSRYQNAFRTVQTRLGQTRRGTPDYTTLQAQAKQLKLLISLQTGDAQLVQPAVKPSDPVEPKPARNIALGVIVGLLLGLGLAFLRDRLDRRIKGEDQIEALLPAVPVIGLVPEPRRGRASRLMTAEGYYTLQANLKLLARDRGLKSMLVTSADPGEGKSSVALNLGLSMAERSDDVLVLDADLRRPSLSERVAADRRIGVSSILAGEGTLEKSIQTREVALSRNGKGPSVALAGTLSLVAAGPAGGNVQLLVGDRSLGALLEETRGRPATVIFDGPPLGSFGDMLPLAKEVDGVIVVVRLYHSRSNRLKRFAAQLANASIEPIGVVVLGARAAPARYYADYLPKR
ncbi:MAG: tyrosine-protein kinase [Thermoleophilaceae bacterium]|nr:tyrosine-protein kinase [Thermoleophilaceae bacterium]